MRESFQIARCCGGMVLLLSAELEAAGAGRKLYRTGGGCK